MTDLPEGTILGPYDSREDWLEARRGGLGGSDIGAILGMSTYSDPLSVYYSKIDPVTSEDERANEEMLIGRDIEGFIVDQWLSREHTGLVVMDQLVIIQSNTHPWLLHSPDGLIQEDGKYVAGLEIKNVRSDANWDPIPEFYYAQVQHGLLATGLPRWTVVALVSGQKLITRDIFPDKEMMGRIALEGEKFWTSHVLKTKPPAPDGSESASNALRRRWEVSEDEIEVIDSDFVQEWRLAKMYLDASKQEYDRLSQVMQAQMGPREHARTIDGEKVATWKTGVRKTIDTRRLKDESPDVAKKYEKTTPTRVFRPAQ